MRRKPVDFLTAAGGLAAMLTVAFYLLSSLDRRAPGNADAILTHLSGEWRGTSTGAQGRTWETRLRMEVEQDGWIRGTELPSVWGCGRGDLVGQYAGFRVILLIRFNKLPIGAPKLCQKNKDIRLDVQMGEEGRLRMTGTSRWELLSIVVYDKIR